MRLSPLNFLLEDDEFGSDFGGGDYGNFNEFDLGIEEEFDWGDDVSFLGSGDDWTTDFNLEQLPDLEPLVMPDLPELEPLQPLQMELPAAVEIPPVAETSAASFLTSSDGSVVTDGSGSPISTGQMLQQNQEPVQLVSPELAQANQNFEATQEAVVAAGNNLNAAISQEDANLAKYQQTVTGVALVSPELVAAEQRNENAVVAAQQAETKLQQVASSEGLVVATIQPQAQEPVQLVSPELAQANQDFEAAQANAVAAGNNLNAAISQEDANLAKYQQTVTGVALVSPELVAAEQRNENAVAAAQQAEATLMNVAGSEGLTSAPAAQPVSQPKTAAEINAANGIVVPEADSSPDGALIQRPLAGSEAIVADEEEAELDGISQEAVAVEVHRGDNLEKIAKANGTTVQDILAANPDLAKNPNMLKVGQEIVVPQNTIYDRSNDADKTNGQLMREARARGEANVTLQDGSVRPTFTADQVAAAASPLTNAVDASSLTDSRKDTVNAAIISQVTAEGYRRAASDQTGVALTQAAVTAGNTAYNRELGAQSTEYADNAAARENARFAATTPPTSTSTATAIENIRNDGAMANARSYDPNAGAIGNFVNMLKDAATDYSDGFNAARNNGASIVQSISAGSKTSDLASGVMSTLPGTSQILSADRLANDPIGLNMQTAGDVLNIVGSVLPGASQLTRLATPGSTVANVLNAGVTVTTGTVAVAGTGIGTYSATEGLIDAFKTEGGNGSVDTWKVVGAAANAVATVLDLVPGVSKPNSLSKPEIANDSGGSSSIRLEPTMDPAVLIEKSTFDEMKVVGSGRANNVIADGAVVPSHGGDSAMKKLDKFKIEIKVEAEKDGAATFGGAAGIENGTGRNMVLLSEDALRNPDLYAGTIAHESGHVAMNRAFQDGKITEHPLSFKLTSMDNSSVYGAGEGWRADEIKQMYTTTAINTSKIDAGVSGDMVSATRQAFTHSENLGNEFNSVRADISEALKDSSAIRTSEVESQKYGPNIVDYTVDVKTADGKSFQFSYPLERGLSQEQAQEKMIGLFSDASGSIDRALERTTNLQKNFETTVAKIPEVKIADIGGVAVADLRQVRGGVLDGVVDTAPPKPIDMLMPDLEIPMAGKSEIPGVSAVSGATPSLDFPSLDGGFPKLDMMHIVNEGAIEFTPVEGASEFKIVKGAERSPSSSVATSAPVESGVGLDKIAEVGVPSQEMLDKANSIRFSGSTREGLTEMDPVFGQRPVGEQNLKGAGVYATATPDNDVAVLYAGNKGTVYQIDSNVTIQKPFDVDSFYSAKDAQAYLESAGMSPKEASAAIGSGQRVSGETIYKQMTVANGGDKDLVNTILKDQMGHDMILYKIQGEQAGVFLDKVAVEPNFTPVDFRPKVSMGELSLVDEPASVSKVELAIFDTKSAQLPLGEVNPKFAEIRDTFNGLVKQEADLRAAGKEIPAELSQTITDMNTNIKQMVNLGAATSEAPIPGVLMDRMSPLLEKAQQYVAPEVRVVGEAVVAAVDVNPQFAEIRGEFSRLITLENDLKASGQAVPAELSALITNMKVEIQPMVSLGVTSPTKLIPDVLMDRMSPLLEKAQDFGLAKPVAEVKPIENFGLKPADDPWKNIEEMFSEEPQPKNRRRGA